MWGGKRTTLPHMLLDVALCVGNVIFWAVRGLRVTPQGQAHLAICMPCSKRQEKVFAQFDFKQVFAGRL